MSKKGYKGIKEKIAFSGLPDEKFNPSPFGILDAKKFPVARKTREGKNGQKLQDGNDEDASLFMRAMRNISFAPKKAASGFLMAEQCPWLKTGKIRKVMAQNKNAKKTEKIEEREEVKREPDETEAFLWAMRNAVPLSGKGRGIAPRPVSGQGGIQADPDFGELLDSRFQFTLMFSDEYLEGHVRGLDEMLMNRLREGQLSPEAHLDLHGLNAEQAFETLKDFIRDSWFKSLRTVLIITGRGRNSPDGQGILRKKLQMWLTQDPFKRVVLAFCTARPYDGGPGSIYALLRKYRKKGRISWDKMPADADLWPDRHH